MRIVFYFQIFWEVKKNVSDAIYFFISVFAVVYRIHGRYMARIYDLNDDNPTQLKLCMMASTTVLPIRQYCWDTTLHP